MGERKGTNLYYPPDYDPKKGGINKFLGTHPLRERARKIDQGILIIRFELPFNIWCNGCGNHIGMGVRYNAEKKRIGNYLSTPIWNFRMKCHLCTNHFEIKTEPKTCEYVIVSGARRQENRWDPKENEQVVAEEKETSRRLQDDSMFKLDHQYGDKKHAHGIQPALEKLSQKRDRQWQDDYSANCALREKFRKKKKELKVQDEKDAALLKKSSLQLELLPETEEVRKGAFQLYHSASKCSKEKIVKKGRPKEFSSMEIFLNKSEDLKETYSCRNIIMKGVQLRTIQNKTEQEVKKLDHKNILHKEKVGFTEKKERLSEEKKDCETNKESDFCLKVPSSSAGLLEKNFITGSEINLEKICSETDVCVIGSDKSCKNSLHNDEVMNLPQNLSKNINVKSSVIKPTKNISLVSNDYYSSSSDEST